MKRVQVYNPKLVKLVEEEALRRSISSSAIVEEILIDHFNVSQNLTEPSGVQIREAVLREITEYVWKQEKNVFDLSEASETFRSLPVERRASVGRSFASCLRAAHQTHTPPLCDVHVLKAKGKVKKSLNNSTLYYIKGFNEYAPYRREKELLEEMFCNSESAQERQEEIDNFVEGMQKRNC